MSKIILLFASLLFTVSSWAACTKDERSGHIDNGWLWTYTGSLGDQTEVAVTMTFAQDKLTAVIFDPRTKKNIRLEGKINDNGEFELSNPATSTQQLRLVGRFLETDPRGKFSSKLNCEVSAGTATLGTEQKPYIFGLEHGYVGSIEHRYARIGAEDDETVERNARKFVEAVSKRDKQSVASLMGYPVRANGVRGDKIINTAEDFLKDYDRIFMPEFSKAISKSRPYHMFVTKYDQALLDRGLVAFSGDGKVAMIMNWNK